jgi:hypothetical protein
MVTTTLRGGEAASPPRERVKKGEDPPESRRLSAQQAAEPQRTFEQDYL